MITRLLFVFVGLALLAFLVWLGIQATADQRLVVWFGFACAIVAPMALGALGIAIRTSDRRILHELARVPEIERLIAEAKTQEEKIKLLEKERENLLATVQLQARRETLLSQREALEQQGVQILRQLEVVETELTDIAEASAASSASKEIEQLHERLRAVRRGEIVFRIGSRYFSVDRDLVLSIPGGRSLWVSLRLISNVLRRKR